MRDQGHLSDQELLLACDGELPARQAERAGAHLAACWSCRARKLEIEKAIANFVRLHEERSALPSAEGPRALLKASLAELADSRPSFVRADWRRVAVACAVLVAAALTAWFWPVRQASKDVAVAVPNPSLTPGATILVDRSEVCRASNTKNKAVPASLERRVLEEYGIAHAAPRAYEIDYLITPALGGADDIRNLWPHSYTNTAWNAQVKDALEDHLRELVCEGRIELATAQREIAVNWIEAYKKYFNTDQPLRTSRQ